MDSFLLFVQIVLINIVLSGDNAVVIAMASRNLPGRQRRLAIVWGTAGAVFLRVVLTFGAAAVLAVPWVQLIGSLMLLYIAVKLLWEDSGGAQVHVKEAVTLRAAVWTILAADFIMSLDNVLAIAAKANGHPVVLAWGIALSIPLIIWGSSRIVRYLNRFPALVWLGAAILGFTAGEMMTKDAMFRQWFGHAHPSVEWVVPALFVLLTLAGGWLGKDRGAAG